MNLNLYWSVFWMSLLPAVSLDSAMEMDQNEEQWVSKMSKKGDGSQTCAKVHASMKDIIRRVYAILPYFDRDHANTAFLHKYKGTMHAMAMGDDILDREAAVYAAVLTPVVFLQRYRDTWCLLERFHRAIRLYQISHPTEKRSALKILQNLRSVNYKIRSMINDFSNDRPLSRTTLALDFVDDNMEEKKDVRYLKELIKNLG